MRAFFLFLLITAVVAAVVVHAQASRAPGKTPDASPGTSRATPTANASGALTRSIVTGSSGGAFLLGRSARAPVLDLYTPFLSIIDQALDAAPDSDGFSQDVAAVGGFAALENRTSDPDWLEADHGPQAYANIDGVWVRQDQERWNLFHRQWHAPASRVRLSEILGDEWMRGFLDHLRTYWADATLEHSDCRNVYRTATELSLAEDTQLTILVSGLFAQLVEKVADAFTGGGASKIVDAVGAVLNASIGSSDIFTAINKAEHYAPLKALDPDVAAIFGPIPQSTENQNDGAGLFAPDGCTRYFCRQGLFKRRWWSSALGCCDGFNHCVCEKGQELADHLGINLVKGSMAERVNIRARFYRYLDLIACKVAPYEEVETVTAGDGKSYTIYYQRPGLYTFWNPVAGIVAGSVIPPTDEDLPIPGHSWSRAEALASLPKAPVQAAGSNLFFRGGLAS